jgi:hypothetical protein
LLSSPLALLFVLVGASSPELLWRSILSLSLLSESRGARGGGGIEGAAGIPMFGASNGGGGAGRSSFISETLPSNFGARTCASVFALLALLIGGASK